MQRRTCPQLLTSFPSRSRRGHSLLLSLRLSFPFYGQLPFFVLPALGGVGVFVAVYVLSHQYDVS